MDRRGGVDRAIGCTAAAQTRPDQQAFFALYKELVETNTAVDVGNCTQAAAQIAARMKAAGYTDQDITPFSVPEHPKDGGLVAVLKGSDAKAKPMLLLGHIDVVAAKREDWVRDPFKLIEEDGYYYGRGTVDDKAMAAIWADAMIRFKQSGYKPKRTIKLALTCGEETTYAFNGAEWLAKNKPDLIAAEFALNEGGGGRYNAKGERELLAIQVGEKAAQNFTFTTTNPGGHSVAAGARQRDLRARRRDQARAGLRIPGQVHRHDARVLRHGGEGADHAQADGATRSPRCSPTPTMPPPTRSSAWTRRCIRRCARPASRPC